MKKYILLILVIILASYVYAANSKLKLDVTLENKMLVPVSQGDLIEFSLNNSDDVVKISEIKPTSLDLTIYLFVHSPDQRVNYITVSNGKLARIDINKDGKGDIFFGYGGHYGNKTLLLIYNPNVGTNLNDVTGNAVANDTSNNNSNTIYYIIGCIILIVILISILVYVNIRKKEA